MATNIHAQSNRVINTYMNKEVTVKITRSDAYLIQRFIRDYLNLNFDNMTDEQRHDLCLLHGMFSRAS
jgi:hypothetical protein